MNTEAVEYVRGIPVVKVFQQTVFSFKNFHNSILNYRDMVYKYTLMWEKPMSTYTVIIHGFVYFLVPTVILIIGYSGVLSEVLLNLFFYILITPVFAQSIMKSMYLNQATGQATEAVNRTEELTDVEPLTESKNPRTISGYDIAFKDVSFSYPGCDHKAIDNISFEVPEGKTFALVGASGGGKTTIARLIPRFWDVDSGQVLIGGIDVKDISLKELMEKCFVCLSKHPAIKKKHCVKISVMASLQATEREIEQALEMSQSREFINKLPNGLNTKIGANGTFLSGGEQQRIALARAFMKNAPIVVLDEATAFADPENEHLIQKALRELTKGKNRSDDSPSINQCCQCGSNTGHRSGENSRAR